MVTINRLESALNASDLGIVQYRRTSGVVQDKFGTVSHAVEADADPTHESGGRQLGADDFQQGESLQYNQSLLESTTIPPSSSRDDGRSREQCATLLLQAIASKSDVESTTMLARLRMGHDWRNIANDLVNHRIIPYTIMR
jgi:hypothetical protein